MKNRWLIQSTYTSFFKNPIQCISKLKKKQGENDFQQVSESFMMKMHRNWHSRGHGSRGKESHLLAKSASSHGKADGRPV